MNRFDPNYLPKFPSHDSITLGLEPQSVNFRELQLRPHHQCATLTIMMQGSIKVICIELSQKII